MTSDRPPPDKPDRPRSASRPQLRPEGKPAWKAPAWKSQGKPRTATDAPQRAYIPPRWMEPQEELDGVILLFGIHAVEAALANPKRVVGKLFMTENAENRMQAALTARGVTAERVFPKDLDRRLGADTVHQGVLMETEPLEELPMNALARSAQGRPLLVLDQVTDPHNVGAVLRSAAVFGAAGVVMTRRHSPPLGGVLAKSASGALELIPTARVQNLARSLEDLKAAGCTIIGLDGDGAVVLDEIVWPEKPVFVLGAEGKGLRQLTKDTCHVVACIATGGQLASLNVSNAAAVALHLDHMHRRKAAAATQAAPPDAR